MAVILKVQFSNSLHRIVAEALTMKLLSRECHGTSLMRSPHRFRCHQATSNYLSLRGHGSVSPYGNKEIYEESSQLLRVQLPWGKIIICHSYHFLTLRWLWLFNKLRPRQNVHHFANSTFKCISLNGNVWIQIKISLKFVPNGPINNIPSLVQIMAWRRKGDKSSSEPMMA